VRTEILENISDIGAGDWNRLAGAEHPFLRHEFLAALEHSGCAAPATGWFPQHVIARNDDGSLAGAMPVYRKNNSRGEFVFDWAWADAYRRAGLRYFPKLVAAVPFTPATGARFLTAPGIDRNTVAPVMVRAALRRAGQTGASSFHVLFPAPEDAEALRSCGLMIRKDCQFHWRNRGYQRFDDFLGEFTAEKRKKARRERRRVAEAGICFRTLRGHEISDALWQQIMPLYATSFWRRGRDPYLNEAFFRAISERLPQSLVMIVALLDAKPVAVAICFRSQDTLYGRYWGSAGDYHSLHFETCYYQGIEYCIAEGLQRFEPGTQGEHKISRGFVPTATWSAHWLSHPRFSAAVGDYLGRERAYIDEYIEAASEHVPYRREHA
jgi:predicted N-acyltransferase